MTELDKTVKGQVRKAVAAERLDKTAAALGQQYWADVSQGENVQAGQPLPGPPPQFEPPLAFIPPEPRVAQLAVLPEGETDVRVEAQVDDGTHEDDREQRVAADPGMEVDIVVESGSPPSRRVDAGSLVLRQDFGQ